MALLGRSCARLLILVASLAALLVVPTLATTGPNLNITFEFFPPDSKCEGTPTFIANWTTASRTAEGCQVPNATVSGSEADLVRTFRAFCFKQNLLLLESVNLLRLELFFQSPACATGGTDAETPETAAIGVPGLRCYAKGELFPDSDVRVYHDCNVSDSAQVSLSLFALTTAILSVVSLIVL